MLHIPYIWLKILVANINACQVQQFMGWNFFLNTNEFQVVLRMNLILTYSQPLVASQEISF